LSSTEFTAPSAQNRYFILITASLLAALGIYLVWVALCLRIDFFDAYETLLNSRKIATLNSTTFYYWKRPFVLPILLSPVFILEHWGSNPNFSLIGAHVGCTALFLLLLFTFYKFLRFEFSSLEALLGTFLLSGNSLLIHYAPFAKEDIPATLFTTAAFYFYWKARITGKRKLLFVSGLLIALAIGTRYNLIPVLCGILIAYEMIEQFLKKRQTLPAQNFKLTARLCALIFFPVALFLIFSSFVYTVLKLAPWTHSLSIFFQDMLKAYLMNSARENPNWNYIFLLKTIPAPLHFFGVYGLFLTFKERRPIALFFLVWLACFFIFQTYFIAVREARYLFPIFPAVYYFILKGAISALNRLLEKNSFAKHSTAISVLFYTAIMVFPLREGFIECLKFKDPVYSYDLPGKISSAIIKKAGDADVFWVGPYYTVYPKDFIFDRNDKVTYIYHFYGNAIEFYTGKTVYHLPVSKYLPALTGERNEPLFLGQGAHKFLKKGDVVVINRDPLLRVTSSLPSTPEPILIEKTNRYEFDLVKHENREEHTYVSRSFPEAQIKSRLLPDNYEITGSGIPDGRYEIYIELDSASRETASFGFAEVKGNTFSKLNSELTEDLSIGKIILFFYDAVETFSLSDVGDNPATYL